MGGQDFSVCFSFDPTNLLSGPAQDNKSAKLNGMPFEVSSVRRLDLHWYLITFDFYVDQSCWDNHG